MNEDINIEIVGDANSNVSREAFIGESKQKLAQFAEEQLGFIV